MKRTVISMLKDATIKYPTTNFVYEMTDKGWFGRTFPVVDEESSYFACALKNLGFKKDDKISILAEGRATWMVSEFGLLKTGCVSVPLSIKLLPEEVLFRINHSESKAVIASRNTIEKLLPILSKFEQPNFKIIYLDSDYEWVKKIFSEKAIDIDNTLLYYDKMIENGKNIFPQLQTELNAGIEQIEEDDVVTISYTSGTTGNPKGIMLTHLNYYANSTDSLSFFKLTEYFRTLIILPLDHAFAHTVGSYIALLDGIGIYFVDSRGGGVNTLKNIPINLKDVSPDFLLTVPALTGNFMKKILDAMYEKGGFVKWLFHKGMRSGIAINGDGFKKAGLLKYLWNVIPYKLADALIFKKVRPIFGANLKFCVGGGALLDVKQQHFFYTLGTPVFQGYGLTEAAPIISANCDHTHKLGSSGKIIPGIELKIIKTDGTEAKTGEKGEIVIRGLNVMKGYYKNEKATAETIRNGWLYTGDMGYMDEDNFLMVVGREKALLISADGEKYSPEGIEEAIMNTSGFVNQVMLYNDHSKFTTALITLEEGRIRSYIKHHKIQNANELLEVIRKSFYKFKHEHEYAHQFPEKWIPTIFRIIPEPFTEQNLMINSTLKMVRFKIVEVYRAMIDEMYSADAKKTNNSNEELLKKFFN